ncbi:hypothetical protein [Cellulomonas composti]|uniref:Uncharacterized protein n=1 Tax=Cellulomonas composti TaxID=266130 RepID=A0A511J7N2_9CELL|nr:hypothetical protein [Cellulomonas composti]GEL93984.1 hypothetical protein CCO02nite_06420 [Cellulomonas composti]
MTHASTVDGIVVALVVGVRLVVPLFIGRFPLPAILASLVVDGLDKSILQAFTGLDLTNYQSYDKALDIYYLSITYLAVLRNWRDRYAVNVVAALWYYRLVGVLLFELTGLRWLLLVFPNTFEYVVIALEVVRTRWDQRRLSHRAVLGLTAFVWIVIKLPQEWWIHVAQLDFTDEFLTRVLGVDPDEGWAAGFANRPWVLAALVGLVVALALGLRWLWPRLPAADWAFTLDADEVARRSGAPVRPAGVRAAVTRWAVVEKVVLVGLVTTILVLSYPRIDARWWAAWVVVAGVVLVHAAVQVWRVRTSRTGPTSLPGLVALNTAISLVAMSVLAALVADGRTGDVALVDALLMAFVVGLMTALYDRWAPESWTARRGEPAPLTAGADSSR